MCKTNHPFRSNGGGGKSSLSNGFALERMWKNLCGKERSERKTLSAVLLLVIDPSLEKKERRKQRHILALPGKTGH